MKRLALILVAFLFCGCNDLGKVKGPPTPPSPIMKVSDLANCPAGKSCVDDSGNMKMGAATIGATGRIAEETNTMTFTDGDNPAGVSLATLAAGAGTDDQTAAEVANTPAGNIAAVTVQNALNELDTEKQAALVSGTDLPYYRTGLIGGGAGDLDAIPVAGLSEGKIAFVTTISGSTVTSYAFKYDETAGALTEASPTTILPDDGDGTDGWRLMTASNQSLLNTANPVFATINLTGDYAITAGTSSSITGKIQLKNSTNNNILTRQSGATSTSYTITEAPAAPGGAAYLVHRNADGTEGYTDPASLGSSAPNNVTPVDTADDNATFYPILVDGATGSQATETDAGISFNPSTNVLTLTGIPVGPASDPTTDNQFARKAYVDSVAAGGGLPTTGGTMTGNILLDDGVGDSPTITFQDATNETAVFNKIDSGFLTITTPAADGVAILTGNLKVGGGSPGQSQDGQDGYVTGMLEVDGMIYADGGVTGNVTGNASGTAGGLSGTPNITVGTISGGAGGFLVDADGDTTAKSLTLAASAAPGFDLRDSDNPGTDKWSASFEAAYVDGADGAENSDVLIYANQGGAKTLIAQFDESDDQWETTKNISAPSATVGALTGVDSIDATGAADMDYGSADVTDHTFVSDGGTVIIDGNISIGADPADAGAIRLPNAGYIYSEADAAGTDISVIGVDSNEVVQIAASGAASVTITPDTTFTGDITVGGAGLTMGVGGVLITTDNDGAVTILGQGNGSDEDININLDDTSNTAVISSSTGVTLLDFGTIGTATTGIVTGGAQTPVIDDPDNFSTNFTGRNLYGGTFIANAAGTAALPDPAAGMNFTYVMEGANANIIDPLATGTADTIVMNGLAAASDENITSSTSGAMCVFQYRAANSWMATCTGWAEATPP